MKIKKGFNYEEFQIFDKERVMEEKEVLISRLQNLAITKRLNFLIGSGASKPAIPLMGEFKDCRNKTRNQQLTERIQTISKVLETDCKMNKNAYNIMKKIEETSIAYKQFIEAIIHLLNLSNSRQIPRSANIFTTNYDLFFEKAIDKVSRNRRLVFNDGAKGYLTRLLDSSNYNQVVSYKGLNDNYVSEIPSVSLIKPHGSVNWMKNRDEIIVTNTVVKNMEVVNPTGGESKDTFLSNHFYEMLRIFQLELDKPQSVLFILGFSFQDKHIGKMIKRALKNPELIVYVFGFSESDRKIFLDNIGLDNELPNFKILTPEKFSDNYITKNHDDKTGTAWYSFVLSNLTEVLTIDKWDGGSESGTI